jgi:hypothetical protein
LELAHGYQKLRGLENASDEKNERAIAFDLAKTILAKLKNGRAVKG